MKINALPVIALLAAVVAFVLLPFNATAACIAFTVIGTLSMLAGDYGRTLEPVRTHAPILPFSPAGAALRQAA